MAPVYVEQLNRGNRFKITLIGIFMAIIWVHCQVLVKASKLDKSWLDKIDISKPKQVENKTKDAGDTGFLTRVMDVTSRHVRAVLDQFGLDSLRPHKGPGLIRFKGDNGIRITTPKPSIVTTEEDIKARKDWGGNCTHKDWVKCSQEMIFGKDAFDIETGKKLTEQMSCVNDTLFPPVCLFNGWTVTRCHLMCLAMDCNGDLKINYDKYVSKDGFC